MVNVTKLQIKINKLLSVFTTLIDALNDAINQLNAGIKSNESAIKVLEADNATYASKITEYETLRDNISGVIGGVKEGGH